MEKPLYCLGWVISYYVMFVFAAYLLGWSFFAGMKRAGWRPQRIIITTFNNDKSGVQLTKATFTDYGDPIEVSEGNSKDSNK
ncbi:MAG: hypothetical protein RR091_09840 [Cloacibacillus sp.]